MWGFYLDISIDLMVIGRLDAHLLSLFKGFNKKSDEDSSHFDHFFCSSLLILLKEEGKNVHDFYTCHEFTYRFLKQANS